MVDKIVKYTPDVLRVWSHFHVTLADIHGAAFCHAHIGYGCTRQNAVWNASYLAFSLKGGRAIRRKPGTPREVKDQCQEVRGASADLQMSSARPSWSPAWLLAGFPKTQPPSQIVSAVALPVLARERASSLRESGAGSPKRRSRPGGASNAEKQTQTPTSTDTQ
jgi:hypothetical protein